MFDSLHKFVEVAAGLGYLRDPAVLESLNEQSKRPAYKGKVRAPGRYTASPGFVFFSTSRQLVGSPAVPAVFWPSQSSRCSSFCCFWCAGLVHPDAALYVCGSVWESPRLPHHRQGAAVLRLQRHRPPRGACVTIAWQTLRLDSSEHVHLQVPRQACLYFCALMNQVYLLRHCMHVLHSMLRTYSARVIVVTITVCSRCVWEYNILCACRAAPLTCWCRWLIRFPAPPRTQPWGRSWFT